MRLIIDADATPNLRELCILALKYNVPVIAFCDTTHELKLSYGEVIVVDKHAQSVDIVLVNYIKKDDIVITQDYGLALICLVKALAVINPNGNKYEYANMELIMASKHENNRLRRTGVHVKGPKKRTKEMENKFLKVVEETLQRI